MAALTLVDLFEEIAAFFWLDPMLEDAAHTVLVLLVVDDGARFGAALGLPGQDLVL